MSENDQGAWHRSEFRRLTPMSRNVALSGFDTRFRLSLYSFQCDVLEAVASGQALARIAELLCQRVEELAPDTICSVLIIDDESRMCPLAAPSLPAAFSRLVENRPIGPDVGSCGAAAYFGQDVEVHDIDADRRWDDFKAIPLAAGVRACWSSPIRSRANRVLGTFTYYYSSCRAPNAREREIVAASVHVLALALENEAVKGRLEQTNSRFEAALSNMSQGLCFFDDMQRLIVANRQYSEIYNIPPGTIQIGMSLREVIDLRRAHGSGPRMPGDEYYQWRESIHNEEKVVETIVELENGRVIAIHHQPMPGTGWIATHEDITDRRRAEARISHMAQHDALTGLPNRALFYERLEQALDPVTHESACAVLCLDLDHFKRVNDSLGHAAGDLLLSAAASRLRTCIQDPDTVSRLGGDEFAILLTADCRRERVSALAMQIVRRLSEPYDLEGQSVVIGTSIGIAISPEDGGSPHKLLKHADIALYRAKLHDRGTYRFFDPDTAAWLQARLTLETDLRRAIAASQFELFYQPIINVKQGAICGFEALLRWHHPTRGLLAPIEFVAMAEETGLIVPLGEWVLRQACAQATGWPDTMKVAVNLSPAQFRPAQFRPAQFHYGEFVEIVRDALAVSGLPAQRLELEITEGVLLADSAASLAILHELKDMGIQISMDDFGTGYSSLSYLRSFPFSKIKIDKSFTREMSERADSLAIVRAVVALGRSLDMITTVEGVETLEQLAILRAEGCTEVQGYLFSPPRPAKDLSLIGSPSWMVSDIRRQANVGPVAAAFSVASDRPPPLPRPQASGSTRKPRLAGR